MTTNLFLILFVALSAVSSLLTEAVKKFCENVKQNPSANLIAFVDAIIVGLGGTICSYILMDIDFNAKNIVSIIAMIFCIWIGSMISYDKVKQTIAQIISKEN